MTSDELIRITVDPNSFARGKPWLSPVLFSDASSVPLLNQTVVVVQPHNDEPDYIGFGVVEEINHDFEIMYINVDWASFKDEV